MTHVPARMQALGAATARRWRAMRGTVRDRGASALEFAIIAAVVVVAASVIGAIVFNIVQKKSNDLRDCSQVAIGTPCAGAGGGAPAGG